MTIILTTTVVRNLCLRTLSCLTTELDRVKRSCTELFKRIFMKALEIYHIKYATIQPDSPLGITFSTFNFQLSIFNFKERIA